ncbi:MAG: WecB/TagA/CpsF family glycosyltransferase [Treponema sp.]|nr:WecB/TagA/CpsF family glycosyltransferase [Treponema sp.]
MAIERISLLGVPVDICPIEELENETLELLASPGAKQVVFLSIWGLLRARGKSAFAQTVANADLVLPISKSIIKGAQFLGKPVPHRYNPFHAVISILSVLDSHYKTLYILGGKKKMLQKAQGNVRKTFPNLTLVGRYVGYYPRVEEDNIIQAIFKASPSLVLVSEGIKEKDCWAFNRRNRFSNSIFLYYHDAIGILSDHIRRVSEKTFDKGLEIWPEIFRNPFKIFLIFPYLYYKILLVWSKLRGNY